MLHGEVSDLCTKRRKSARVGLSQPSCWFVKEDKAGILYFQYMTPS